MPAVDAHFNGHAHKETFSAFGQSKYLKLINSSFRRHKNRGIVVDGWKRAWVTALLVLIGGLTACSGGTPLSGTSDTTAEVSGETSEESVPADLPPGFFLSGEFVELRPYDVNDPTVEWIKPCTEIPEEVLGGTGLNLEFSVDDGFADMWTCSADIEDFAHWGSSISITTGPTPVSQFVDAGLVVEGVESEILPQATIHRIFGGDDTVCAASLDTSRGYFSVSAMNFEEQMPIESKCGLAISQIDSIYTDLRGNI